MTHSHFKSMDVRAILDKEPQHWTSEEAVLIMGCALMLFNLLCENAERNDDPNIGRRLTAVSSTIAVYAAPRIDTEILIPWDYAKEFLLSSLKKED